MKIKVLGTVSPYCKDTKNCPGFLVTTEDNKILLDCGNGITRYLNFPEDLNNLTIIISHLHKDHYGDLSSIAYASYVFHNLELLNTKIKIYLPRPDKLSKHDFQLLTNLGEEHYFDIFTYDESTTIKNPNQEITFSTNPHNISSYAIKVKDKNTTLVYSGDTGYLGNTIERFAAGANLLICESTFLKNQTRKKDFHLYAHEAANIAKTAHVNNLLLTHFWPDIDKQEYLKEAIPIFSNTKVAEEQQVLSLK